MKLRKVMNRGLVSVLALGALVSVKPLMEEWNLSPILVSAESASESEEVEENPIDGIRQAMLEATPILEIQFNQIPEEEWIAYADRVNAEGGDPATVFDWAIEDHPTVFEAGADYFRQAMVNEFNLDEDSLDQVTDRDLLWLEYSIWIQAEGQEDLPALAQALVDDHGVEVVPEESSSEETSEESSETSSEDESSSDESEETPSEDEENPFDLAELKQIMIDETPILAAEFDVISAENWEAYAQEVNLEEGGAVQVYNSAFENHPEVFQDTINYIRRTLVDDHHLNEASLGQILDLDLVWLEYEVWLNNGGQSDFVELANILVDHYSVERDEATDEERWAKIKQAMLDSTPITSGQFDKIPAATWLAYADKINAEGGDPSTAFNWALRDYPAVFADRIAYLRNELVTKHNLDRDSLNQLVSDQNLLWEEYTIWVNNGGNEDLAALSQRLVQKYGVKQVAVTDPKQPTLPNTGEERRSPVVSLLIIVLGVAGVTLLGFKDKVFK